MWARLHVLQQEAVQRAIEFALFLSQYTPSVCLIVLIFRSSESLIFINMYIKFHFNPMISSWGAIFNVPECMSKSQFYLILLYFQSMSSENKNNSRSLNFRFGILFLRLQTCIYFVFHYPVFFIFSASDNTFCTYITLKGSM